ncbi:MAG: hypothetical protein IT585_00310 [candidate division Zixibacteria bacterium]|nr:hypothetical protein [candidate division Zixibacteria bacterium]
MDLHSFFVGLALGAAVATAIILAFRNRPVNLAKPARVPLGRYLAGMPGLGGPIDFVECLVDEVAYILISKHDQELGRIPRAAVLNVFCEEKPKLLERLSATKHVSFEALGINTARPRPVRGYCLVIDWDDAGTRQNAIFEFISVTPRADAHRVETVLKRFRKAHLPALRADEKNCPSCAEVIKKNALVCRYCGQRTRIDITEASHLPLQQFLHN